MIWLMFILIGIASIITSFYSTLWCWLILVFPEFYIVIVYWSVIHQKYKSIDNISEEANILFQEFGFYFLHQIASRDIGASAVIIAYAKVVVGVINIFYNFYYGLAIAILNSFLMNHISNRINPYNNHWRDHEREISKEILNYFLEKTKKT